MKEYTKIPVRPEEHQRLVALTYSLVGKIPSYLNKPSYSDVIKHLLDHYEGDKNMNAAQARKLAVETIEHADEEGQPVADTTVVGRDSNGYWVTDNGEEVSNLTKEQAITIIVENLTANNDDD